MLVVDLLHEVELGVWKAVFTHLVRLLYAAAPGGSLVAKLDKRYISCLIFRYADLICIAGSDWFQHSGAAPSVGFHLILRK